MENPTLLLTRKEGGHRLFTQPKPTPSNTEEPLFHYLVNISSTYKDTWTKIYTRPF